MMTQAVLARGAWYRTGLSVSWRTARVVAEALADGRHDAEPASLVLELPVLVRSGEHLDQAIEALDRSGCAAVPVLEADRLVGWISYRAALRAMPSRAPASGGKRREAAR